MGPTLSPAETQALATFRERVTALLGDNLLRIVLFGSRARGEGHEESDLDLLVLVRATTSSSVTPRSPSAAPTTQRCLRRSRS